MIAEEQRIHDLAYAVDVAKAQQAEYKDRIAQGKEALAAEQREHDMTRRQRDTLQTQCEDMQSEMETKLNNTALKPSVGVDNQAIVDIVVEKDDKISILMQRVAHADERLETANAMATTYADANAALKKELAITTQRLENSLKVTDEMVNTDMRDEMACMAEEVIGIKANIADLHGAVEDANELRDSYKRTALTLSDAGAKLMQELTDSINRAVNVANTNGELKQQLGNCNNVRTSQMELNRDLRSEIHTLQESAETQAMFMQQVDAACKAAEAKVIEQRKEIEALKAGDDLWICPSADGCVVLCDHKEPHKKKSQCQRKCRLLDAPRPPCVKVNTCKECDRLRGVLLSRTGKVATLELREIELREEIINRDAVILEQERKADRTDEIMRTAFEQLKQLRGCVEKRNAVTEKHNSYIVMLSCKAGDMPNIERNECRHFDVCDYAKRENHTCTNGGGEYCGVWRHKEARR